MKQLDLKMFRFGLFIFVTRGNSTQLSQEIVRSGQSYKKITLIIYKSRVIIWDIFKSATTLES